MRPKGVPSLTSAVATQYMSARPRISQMLFQVKSWRSLRSLWVRILALHDIYLIINDWVGLGYLIFVLITVDNYISLLHAMIIIWAFQLLVFQVFVTLRLYMTRRYVPPEVVVFFSVYKVRPAFPRT